MRKRISKLFGLRINLDDIELSLNKIGYKVFLNINDEKIDIIYDRQILMLAKKILLGKI